MHCNLRPPEPRQSFSDQRHHAKLEVAEPIICCIITFLLLVHYFTLWPWLSPSTYIVVKYHAQYSANINPGIHAIGLLAERREPQKTLLFTGKIFHFLAQNEIRAIFAYFCLNVVAMATPLYFENSDSIDSSTPKARLLTKKISQCLM